MNMFFIIQNATSRIEPFHSRYLAAVLKESTEGDGTFFSAFWRMATQDLWPIPEVLNTGMFEVIPEDPLEVGRIDITVKDKENRRILGIEVKTSDRSATQGQLERYLESLKKKYAGQEIHVAYLTPFNKTRAEQHVAEQYAEALASVQEFKEFQKIHPLSVHISWLDVAEINRDGDDVWRQHQHFVRDTICNENKLRVRNRGFEIFFEKAAGEFEETLAGLGLDINNHELDAASIKDPASFAAAFRVLIESPKTHKAVVRPNKFPDDLKQIFLKSEFYAIHSALFSLAGEYPHVWVEGTSDYGLRVAHPDHSAGVSMIRSLGPGRFAVMQPR